MIIDAFTLMGDAQTVTTGASTSYIDTLAAGDAAVGAWFVAWMNTSMNSSATATVTFALHTSDGTGFGTAEGETAATVASSAALTFSSLGVGEAWKIRIPSGVLRYLRGYMSVSAAAPTAGGKVDFFIVKDADMNAQLIA